MDDTKQSSWNLENIIKISSPLLTVAAVVIGMYQFNSGQRESRRKDQLQADRDIVSKFKENQNKVYSSALSVISYLATSTDYKSAAYKDNLDKFNQLYWVQLSYVDSREVDSALDVFHNSLENLRRMDYKTGFSKFDDIVESLPDQALSVSMAMKRSSIDYSLPKYIKAIDSTHQD